MTVRQPTCVTELSDCGTFGPHMAPPVAKHRKYDRECAKRGWKMVPFVLESYGAAGLEARRLLLRMSAHSLERSPQDFLLHAERVLPVALQSGNARVAAVGTASEKATLYTLVFGMSMKRMRMIVCDVKRAYEN